MPNDHAPMTSGFRKKVAGTLFIGLLAFIAVVGVGLRWHAGLTPFLSSNVDTFYFQRTALLVEHGVFPKEDRWGFAPEVWPENTPPALGYLTWGAFSLWKVVAPETDLETFANFFPILMYVLWFAATVAVLLALGVGGAAVIIMAILVTFTPVAIRVTGYGRYFEEVIGAPAIFLAAMVFPAVRRIDWVFWSGIAALTILVLSWQAFPFFYAAAFGVILAGFARRARDLKALGVKLLMLIAPLFLAEAIVRLFVGNSYSAFGMVKEFYLAFVHRNDPMMLNAMYRRDWGNTPWKTFVEYYGAAGMFLLVAGLAASLLRPRERQSHGALVFGAAGAVLVGMFAKFRHFALGFFAAPWVLGTEAVLDPHRFLDAFRDIGGWVFNRRRKIVSGLLGGVAAALCLLGAYTIWAWRVPDPIGNVAVTAKSAAGDVYAVEIRMTNAGGRTSPMKKAFAGFHIAVEGGDILRAEPFTDGIGAPSLGTKSFSHWGNANFFEVSYPRLLEHDSAGVQLAIRKTSDKPIVISWRAWLPKYYCSLKDRREGIEDLRSGWRNLLQGWRNEKCIVRIPANNDASADFCPTKVFAAHEELQDFRCRSVEVL